MSDNNRFIKLVEDYLNELDWRVRENSNQIYSFSGLSLHLSTSVIAEYTLNKIYPEKIANRHRDGWFHIHDLGHGIIGYCAGHSLKQLITRGFGGVPGYTESRPARHLDSIVWQMINFLGVMQNEWAGAQAFNSVDTYLAPYVRKDKLNYKQVKQCIQALIYNSNIPSRWGGQAPFINFTFDLEPPEDLKDQPAMVGDEFMDFSYGDLQEEMNMINKAFLEIMLEGDAKGKPFTFPIPTYNITKDFDWDSEITDLLFEVTGKYGIPYFQNFVNSDLDPRDVRSMCLFEDEEIIIRKNGKIKRIKIKDFEKEFKCTYDKEGWAEVNEDIETMSLNPETYKLEWVKIKRLYKTRDNVLVKIRTNDGKEIRVTEDHPVAVYTPEGIKYKKAKDLKGEELLITTKNGSSLLNKDYQYLGDEILDENLAFLLGLFVADGNYLFNTKGKIRGIQYSFHAEDKELIEKVKKLVFERYGYEMKFKKGPRYRYSLYGYIYNSRLAEKWYNSGFLKYGRLPDILFNSPKSVMESFLEGFFAGDGYKRGKEIHINDEELSRDLVILMNLIGIPNTYRKRERSQVIRIQHVNGRGSKTNTIKVDILYNRYPKYVLEKNHSIYSALGSLVCERTVLKYNLESEEFKKLKEGDFAIVKIEKIEKIVSDQKIDFYDIELERNHYFVHSLGNITHNCCRLSLDLRELRNKTGGLFGAGEQTGCYDEETKVLTSNGWKYFKDVDIEKDLIATLDPKTHELKFVKATEKFVYDYDGELIQFYNEKGFESPLVTPNHRMYVEVLRENGYEPIFRRADSDLSSTKYTLPKKAFWKGKIQEFVEIPEIIVEIEQDVKKRFYIGKRKIKKVYPKLRFKTNDFLEFLGIWIGDGYADKRKEYRITLVHGNNERKKKYYKEVLERLGIKFREDKDSYEIYSIQLYNYLKDNIGIGWNNKRIPKDILELDICHLEHLLKGLLNSDGYIKEGRSMIYYTSNKELAYDVLNLVVRLGYSGRIVSRESRVSYIENRKIESKETYEVVILKTERRYYCTLKKRKIRYKGKVYCLCVPPYHVMLVERNGNIMWCGNSIGVVTINMPRIGYVSKDEDQFFDILEELMEDAKESLEIKRKVITENMKRGLMPYSKVYLGTFDHHFSTIGLVGMNEACLNLLGVNIADPEGHKFAIKVLDFMRDKITEFQEETGNLYNLEATPAESTCYRLAKIDKKKYPDIIVANEFTSYKETGVPYYTNSTHLPVDYTDDLYFTLKHQEPLQSRYTGGTVLHVYLDEPVDKDTAKLLIKKAVYGFRIPYYSISPRFSICPIHGYIPGWVDKCPY